MLAAKDHANVVGGILGAIICGHGLALWLTSQQLGESTEYDPWQSHMVLANQGGVPVLVAFRSTDYSVKKKKEYCTEYSVRVLVTEDPREARRRAWKRQKGLEAGPTTANGPDKSGHTCKGSRRFGGEGGSRFLSLGCCIREAR